MLNLVKSIAKRLQLVQAVSVSLIIQILSSITNLGINFYLLHSAETREYGLYGLGFAVTMLMASISTSLFLVPMTVLASNKVDSERREFISTCYALVIMFCVLFGITVLSAYFFCLGVGISFKINNYYVGALVVFSVTSIVRDFFIRWAFLLRREIVALKAQIFLSVATFAGFFFCISQNIVIDATGAILISAGVQVLAGTYLYFISEIRFRPTAPKLFDCMINIWKFGKWSTVANITDFARIQSYSLIVASFIGAVGLARLNAARLLVTPAVMLIPVFSQIALPRLSNLAEHKDIHKFCTHSLIFFLSLTGLATSYSLLVVIFYSHVAALLIPFTYGDLFYFVILWSIWAILLSVRAGVEVVAQSKFMFRTLGYVGGICTMPAIFLTIILISKFGLDGSLISLILVEFTMILMLVYRLQKDGLSLFLISLRPIAYFRRK